MKPKSEIKSKIRELLYSTQLNVKVPEPVKYGLDALAISQKRTVMSIVNEALAGHLFKQESIHQTVAPYMRQLENLRRQATELQERQADATLTK